MRLGTRITAGFALPLVFVVLIGIAGGISAHRQSETSQWVTHTQDVLVSLESTIASLVDIETASRGYALTADVGVLEPFEQAEQTLPAQLTRLRMLTADNPVQQAKVSQLEQQARQKLTYAHALIDMRKRSGLEPTVAMARDGRGDLLMRDARRTVEDMKTEEFRLLSERKDSSTEASRQAYVVIGGGALGAFIVVLFGAVAVTRSITGPLTRMLDGVEQIARGQLDVRMDANRPDELGAFAAAFNRMTESRQRSEAQMAEVIGMLSSSGSELLAATTQQAAGVQEQSAAISQVVSTVNEVSQTSEQAAERTRLVADAARRSDDVALGGRRAVEESLSVLDRARRQTDQVAQNILALAEQAQTIDEVLTTINELADQTNLLSLNAAVEAARAGEQGRGFQVVAGQIKDLASQSKQATVQVRRILGEVQKRSNGAVLSTEEGTRSMSAAVKAATDAGETIRSLAEITADVAQSVAQISGSAGQQATGMAQISQAMRNINQVTQQNLQATRQTEQTAQSLTALGLRLKQMVTR